MSGVQRVEDRPRVLEGRREGLLADDVDALPGRLLDQLAMREGRRADVDEIGALRSERLVRRSVEPRLWEDLMGGLAIGPGEIGDSHDLDFVKEKHHGPTCSNIKDTLEIRSRVTEKARNQ